MSSAIPAQFTIGVTHRRTPQLLCQLGLIEQVEDPARQGFSALPFNNPARFAVAQQASDISIRTAALNDAAVRIMAAGL